MRRLLLLRHAKAERGFAGLDDHERALEPRGHNDARLMGAYLARHAMLPDRAVVSPSKRTTQTWEEVRTELDPFPSLHSEPRLYNASADTILDVIRETPAGAQTLLVVGHNPGLHETAFQFVASGETEARARLYDNFPTAALAVIEFPIHDWAEIQPLSGRLERYVTPKLLNLPAD